MRALRCLLRGGHRWTTVTDAVGSLTSCARCGAVKRSRESRGDAFFRSHTNMGYRVHPRKRGRGT